LIKNTISAKLFGTLQKGKEQLGVEAIRRIVGFVESQQTEEDAFSDKGGKSDLYYSSFGWMLSYLLDIKKIDTKKMDLYLSQQDTDALDLTHYAAYMRCLMIKRLMRGGKIGLLVRSLFATNIRALNSFESVPHNDVRSPYTRFIWLSLLEDAGQQIKGKKEIVNSWVDYRLSGGGYTNIKDGLTATTNATVAALATKGQLTGYNINDDVRYLRDRQNDSGGFTAAEASPIPDLLSTATALFMLNCYDIRPNYSARDFVEAHWLDSGGFAATLLDDRSDVEYTFYGLLALGSL
jgi:prenyltransferase beta subunit